jgi:hypothetical protein
MQYRIDSIIPPHISKFLTPSINLPNYGYIFYQKKINMNTSTLVMVAVLAAVVVVPIQQASAQDTSFSFRQRQSNECSGFAGCSNSGTITFSP